MTSYSVFNASLSLNQTPKECNLYVGKSISELQIQVATHVF